VSVDLSGAYLERARENFRLNDLSCESHRFVEEDVFRAFDRFRRKGEIFDIIIVDPPSFSHGPDGKLSVRKDYARLVSAALRILKPNGWLVAATNQGSISPKEFRGILTDGSQKAGRSLRIIHEGSAPIDFPAALEFPQSRYLKCWVLQG